MTDDEFEEQEARRREEQDRADRAAEKGVQPVPIETDAEGRVTQGNHRAAALRYLGLTCPVHTGTPEPCPECGSKIAAGL